MCQGRLAAQLAAVASPRCVLECFTSRLLRVEKAVVLLVGL